MPKSVYQSMIQADGLASDQTIYLDKIPVGRVAIIESFTAYTYTTVIGDYETAKNIYVGFEHEGEVFYVEAVHRFAADSKQNIVAAGKTIILNEGDRLCATFKATATTTTHKLVATGWLIDKADLK